jgi:hypothetical protein
VSEDEFADLVIDYHHDEEGHCWHCEVKGLQVPESGSRVDRWDVYDEKDDAGLR